MTTTGNASVPVAPAATGFAIPASALGIVLGMSGLANCWKLAHTLWGASLVVHDVLFAVTTLIWAVLVLSFAAKWIWQRDEALAEARHPVACCFIGLIPVATMLVAVWLHGYMPALGAVLIALGAAAQLGFSTFRSGGMMRGGRKLGDTTAVMYLPTVAGNFVSAIALSALGWGDLAKLFFGAGLFSWLAIESILTYRLYLGDELPPAIRPTLGIQLAPPVVGAVAYLTVTGGSLDWPFYAMFGYGLMQFLFLARLAGWFSASGTTPAFWAFSFGVTALGLACLRAAALAPNSLFASLALPLFVFVNLFIGALFLMTLRLLLQGRLFRRSV
ncbi:dicarboxylate transporter/tellurite-resistance protein TehA [Cupriavidus pampae]|uniref:Tellurite resistance protein TehA n=1 Tax=Cupriavidus pampae TaxID=659251 RepID=A0ABN7XZ55_9BURK|nr:dicarboxylate transporter/tellurite-resistance protein TehA [Cupriavidus pampae]CAG9166383.1 Tellurite resistance protein TehA [Cupriavidus pampae]